MKQYLAEKREYQKEYLEVNIQGKKQMLPLNAVHYFVSDVRKIGAVYLNDEKEVWFYGKLDNLEEQLKQYNFIRCHQSYLINGNKVEDVKGDEIITSGGSFQISRKYTISVREKWEEVKKRLYNNANITSIGMRVNNDVADDDDNILLEESKTLMMTTAHKFGAVKYGTIVGLHGFNQNISYRLYENDEAIIGRDGSKVHIVINDAKISRKHCGIKFSECEQCYYVKDYSTNGTYISNIGELQKNQWTRVDRDSLIKLINERYTFVLV